ncbi:MAG: response regulator [Myxococcota bacterium]
MARVLVVDDEPRFRRYLAQALAREGHEVIAAEGELEALEKLGSFELQVLVADWMLGAGHNGLELAARLRDRFPQLRTILITGYPASDLARTEGVDRLLAKPFAPVALCNAVAELTTPKRS